MGGHAQDRNAVSFSVRRRVSETPLAKAHESLLSRGVVRPKKAIDWSAFDRGAYPGAALALATDQAYRLAEGEYGAVGLFGQVASGLALTRAPFDIISAAALISGDEIRHADYCVRFAELCSGEPIELAIARDEVLRACAHLERPEEVDYFLLKYSAIGETLAAALLTESRRGATDPVARALYTSLAADEVHHARLGWYYFAWRAPSWSRAEKQRLAERIAEFVVGLEREFWVGRDAPRASADAARALGVLDSERQRAAIAAVMTEDIVPGLDALGLGGSQIWAGRYRGGSGVETGAPSLVLNDLVARPSSDAATEAAVATAGRRAPEPNARPADALAVDLDARVELAVAWLASSVNATGGIRFSIDAFGGGALPSRPFVHGRAAIVLSALRSHPGHAAAERLAAWLSEELRAGLVGSPREDWPTNDDEVAGTVALAVLAELPFDVELSGLAARLGALRPTAWHAAQVVLALGESAPDFLWRVCVEDLPKNPWAPWTVRAARTLGDERARLVGVRGLLAALAPLDRRGSAIDGASPPLAVVAASLEALDEEDSNEALDRIAAGLAYLRRWQLVDPLPPGCDPAARGAFPLTPTDYALRTDVTAHSVLAMAARARRSDR